MEMALIQPDLSKFNLIFLVEPFYGGSHKQLIDVLHKNLAQSTLVTLSAKKWPWRARCGALILANKIPVCTTENVLFSSSVISLAELLGLRPDLQRLRKIVYFHENQFIYPVREVKKRDIQFAYNQITTWIVVYTNIHRDLPLGITRFSTSLAADVIIFNSEFNKNSLLDNLNRIVKLLPDYRPKGLRLKIEPKCKVIYFPVYFPIFQPAERCTNQLHIVWPHRWEFDKDPESFLDTIKRLKVSGYNFKLSIVGETFTDVPEAFQNSKDILEDCLLHFGYLENKEDYYDVLRSCHVAVSTAVHEFFGVSMIEASYFGCFPLVPNRLVYPEIYPKECLYNNLDELFNRLASYCQNIESVTKLNDCVKLDFNKYSMDTVLPLYLELFQ